MKSVVIGASGYTGAELLRILAFHPDIEVVSAGASGNAGQLICDLYPSLLPHYEGAVFSEVDSLVNDLANQIQKVDIAFLALPHGISQNIVPRIYDNVGLIVDLSADFRLTDPNDYKVWYNAEHAAPDFLEKAVYGLPELTRNELKGARLVASAGCYVTCSTLPLAPLLAGGIIEPHSIIIDAASGASGAGRSVKANYLFGEVGENFSAYGLKNHRHTPEIEQNLKAQVLFTPHLLPTSRGILATTYSRPTARFQDWLNSAADREKHGSEFVLSALADAYEQEPFVFVTKSPPSIKSTLGSNNAMVWGTYDDRTNTIITVSALDNLVKGASGQAIQCANIALGLPESAGLGSLGLYP
ncbi:MAG: N-acetyl-gamma-glutamyl-phosphate reductase [Actinomycetota bacterium]|nr:MAG: N-acetyl-gamma-glutamyl-phosphate reductase [Actinomycetota bacterium]